MARTNKRGGNTAGLRGFQAYHKPGTPMKFLGGVGKFLKKAVNTTPIGMGINALRGKTDAPTFGNIGEKLMGGGGNDPVAAAQAAQAGVGATQMGGMGANAPMMKKEGFTPYKKPTPFKTDTTLVSGAYDAASGMGTAKYGQIAQARAFGDMVGSVEETVNRSAKAQLKKDRTRAKRTQRAHNKYGKWKERMDERRQRRGITPQDPTGEHGGGDYSYYWK